jgi:zinc transport system ATP-binding protein
VHVTAVLEVHGAGASYDGRPVLTDVSLSLAPGELLAVLGANGSGKSTLVRTVLGLTPLATGTVELFGSPLHGFDAWARVGYVPQRVGATAGVPATVREVVAAGRLPRMRRFARSRAVDRAAVDAALETVGLADRAADSVSTLSGGQQQRVLVARALATEPDLLVLDEPTAGVDIATKADIVKLVHGLADQGCGVVVISSELPELLALADRIVILRDGTVERDLPRSEVADEPQLHRLIQERAA